MTQVTLTVNDGEVKTIVQKAVLAVNKLPDKIVKVEMQAAREEARFYPPELPDQQYIRTGKRYAATKLVKVERAKYRIESTPRYRYGQTGNPYIIGDARGRGQARIHEGRWNLLADVMARAVERIVQKGREYFRAVLERNGAP